MFWLQYSTVYLQLFFDDIYVDRFYPSLHLLQASSKVSLSLFSVQICSDIFQDCSISHCLEASHRYIFSKRMHIRSNSLLFVLPLEITAFVSLSQSGRSVHLAHL